MYLMAFAELSILKRCIMGFFVHAISHQIQMFLSFSRAM